MGYLRGIVQARRGITNSAKAKFGLAPASRFGAQAQEGAGVRLSNSIKSHSSKPHNSVSAGTSGPAHPEGKCKTLNRDEGQDSGQSNFNEMPFDETAPVSRPLKKIRKKNLHPAPRERNEGLASSASKQGSLENPVDWFDDAAISGSNKTPDTASRHLGRPVKQASKTTGAHKNSDIQYKTSSVERLTPDNNRVGGNTGLAGGEKIPVALTLDQQSVQQNKTNKKSNTSEKKYAANDRADRVQHEADTQHQHPHSKEHNSLPQSLPPSAKKLERPGHERPGHKASINPQYARTGRTGPARNTPASGAELRIGQVNVVVEAPAAATPTPGKTSTGDLSSRLFLRSL